MEAQAASESSGYRSGCHAGFFEKRGKPAAAPTSQLETVPVTNVLAARTCLWKNSRTVACLLVTVHAHYSNTCADLKGGGGGGSPSCMNPCRCILSCIFNTGPPQ